MHRVLLVFLSTFLLTATPTLAQSLSFDGAGGLELWADDHAYHRHRVWLKGSLDGRIGSVAGGVYMKGIVWGAAGTDTDSSIESPLVAEFIKVIERKHGAKLLFDVGPFKVGPQIHRRAVHHVWRLREVLEGRHDYFPIKGKGSWSTAERRCQKNELPNSAPWADGWCPSLGYWEAIGIRIESRYADVSILPYRYKQLTLTPRTAFGEFRYSYQKWSVRVSWAVDIHRKLFYDLQISRSVDPVRIGLRYGLRDGPDWRNEIARFGLVLSVD